MTLMVNGIACEQAGSVLDAVLAAGVDLPHLCKDDNLPPIGACRTCIVEADGRLVAACSLPAASVTQVDTRSERAVRVRRTVLELTLAMQSSDAVAGGPVSGETARVAGLAGAIPGRFAPRVRDQIDASNPFFSFHEAACILCGRCVAACQQLQHISAIGLAGHGHETRVTPGAAEPFAESICTSCGSCIAACPTSALRPKAATS